MALSGTLTTLKITKELIVRRITQPKSIPLKTQLFPVVFTPTGANTPIEVVRLYET